MRKETMCKCAAAFWMLTAIVSVSLSVGMIGFRVDAGDVGVAGSTVDWWSMFRHDLNHSGYSSGGAPSANMTAWSYTTVQAVFSSPAVADDMLYVGSVDNKVYALNASTGAIVWNYTTGSFVYSSPTVAGGIVYIGSHDNIIYALNAANGVLVWNCTTGGDVYSSPTVADGRVYVGSADRKVYALDASTGALVWNYTTSNAVYSSPAVADGRVFIGSNDTKVYALNATSGAFLWSYTTGNAVYSSPSVAYGLVYVGSYDNKVYALNATTGARVWSYTTAGAVHSSPAVWDGRVYVGSFDKKVYALNASTGTRIWNFTTGGYVDSSPAVADGKVFIGSRDFKVHALNVSTGALLWSYATGQAVYSSPSVADGRVFVGSYDRKVYCFGSHDVAVKSVIASPTVVQAGETVNVQAVAKNEGIETETFNVTAYVNDTAIGTQTVNSLAPGAETTLTFNWDTTGAAGGNYTIKAVASTVPGETDTADNTFIDGDVKVVSPPVAAFTFSPALPLTGQAVTFNASLSSPDGGTIVSYVWSFGDGTPNGTGMITTHAYGDNGTYTVTLTITDTDGLTDTESQNVPVQNRPPVAFFTESATTVQTGIVISFNASGTYDPDGTIVSYFWDFGDTRNSTGITTEHAYADNGTYTVTLTVTDDDGATASVTANKTILNRNPVALFTESAETVFTGTLIQFNASDSYDPDGFIVAYEWNFGDGNYGAGIFTEHSYAEDGVYNVTLTVTDNDGASSQVWALKTILDRPPLANFTESAEAVFASETISFDASDSYDPDGTIVSYVWDFGDGTNATGVSVDHAYENNGTYTVTLTVTDNDGTSASISAVKNVFNRADIAVIDVSSSKTIVGIDYALEVNVTVVNRGAFTETFNVTVYANDTAVATEAVTLASGNSTTATLTWNTTGFAEGNCSIWVYAWPLPGEANTADNTMTDGWVFVTIAGDVTSASGLPDGRVDMRDIGAVCNEFMTTDPNCDINGDGVVNMRDIGIACGNFLKT